MKQKKAMGMSMTKYNFFYLQLFKLKRFNWFRIRGSDEPSVEPNELIPCDMIKQEILNDIDMMENGYVNVEKDFFFYYLYYTIKWQ